MATVKKPIKKEQRVIAKDNTRVANNFNVSKLLRQEKDAKRLKSDVKRVTRPYTVIAKPDPEAMFPGDSIRYYTGQRGGVGVPYIRDVAGSKGGLLGINTRTSDAEFAKASRDKKNFRTYQDTLAVKANFEKKKNGGPVQKAKDGVKTIGPNKYAKEQILNSKKKKAYVATNTGTIHSIDNKRMQTIDTTGYSKNKPTFELKENGKKSTVKRKDVLPLLNNMKKNVKAKAGAMIKRADGSMSRRGLWDNIRANKGSGKKPTAAMLKQEKKIKAKSKK